MSANHPENIRLTSTVKKGGCAAKLPAGTLRAVLGQMKLRSAPELMVGVQTLDDAAVWNLGDGRLLIQTLDFFTPIVDDAKTFGMIAACNALSDVYAMGGAPATAMTILAFPMAVLPERMLGELMEGALEKIHEAGASLVGGHSIDDETLKLGFSVSGFVNENEVWKNSGARAGDVLILTKPLGTGFITSGLKNQSAKDSWVEAAVQSMTTLNKAPELISADLKSAVHAATDITGFGLLGHLLQLAQASGVRLELAAEQLPVLHGAREAFEIGVRNRAHKTNRDYVEAHVDWGSSSEFDRLIGLDAQTSGGLLLCVAPESAPMVLSNLKTKFSGASVVGKVLVGTTQEPTIRLRQKFV